MITQRLEEDRQPVAMQPKLNKKMRVQTVMTLIIYIFKIVLKIMKIMRMKMKN